MKKRIYACICFMLICCSLFLKASTQQSVQVTTPDSSLEAKVLKAYRSGEYVVVDMLLRNVSRVDYTLSFSFINASRISVYDEIGNIYTKNIVGRFGNENNALSIVPKALLPSGVPVRFSLFIPGISEEIIFLPYINFGYCRPEGYDFNSWKMTVKNVKIVE